SLSLCVNRAHECDCQSKRYEFSSHCFSLRTFELGCGIIRQRGEDLIYQIGPAVKAAKLFLPQSNRRINSLTAPSTAYRGHGRNRKQQQNNRAKRGGIVWRDSE